MSKAAVHGSNQTRPDIYGFVKRTTWSNVSSLENYRGIVLGVQVALEAMKFEIHDDVVGHVKTLMSRIPKLDFAAPVEEERYSPEAERIKSQRAFMGRG